VKAFVPLVLRLMGGMAICALVFGAIGYFWAPMPNDVQEGSASRVAPEVSRGLVGV
jgi:hypothetical protein